jgi:hypothetical protein
LNWKKFVESSPELALYREKKSPDEEDLTDPNVRYVIEDILKVRKNVCNVVY